MTSTDPVAARDLDPQPTDTPDVLSDDALDDVAGGVYRHVRSVAISAEGKNTQLRVTTAT